MRRFSWFKKVSHEDGTSQIYKTELSLLPKVNSHQLLVKVISCVLCNKNNPGNDCNNELAPDSAVLPLATDIIGKIEKTGEDVSLFHVGDIIIGIVDFESTQQSGCSHYCLIDESCALLKPTQLKNEDVLCLFSDMMQIELLLNFLPKFPIKHSFFISGNIILPINRLLVYKLLSMNCKVIGCTDNNRDAEYINSVFKDLVVIDTNTYNELNVAIMDETCGLGVSAIFHLGSNLDNYYANSLLQCLAFNGTIVLNSVSDVHTKSNMCNTSYGITDGQKKTSNNIITPLSITDSVWQKKSTVVHYFNYDTTIHCGYFVNSFYEIGKKVLSNLSTTPTIELDKSIIDITELEEFIKKENIFNSLNNRKYIVNFSTTPDDC